jgi:hypothetical protein
MMDLEGTRANQLPTRPATVADDRHCAAASERVSARNSTGLPGFIRHEHA